MKKKLFTLLIAMILLTLTIYSASALQIEEIQDRDVHIGATFSYDVELVSYENLSNLTYSLVEKPSSMEISADGEISWLPKLKDVGVHTVRVNVSNESVSDVEEFTLNVVYSSLITNLNTGSAPTLAIIEQQYEFELIASSNYPLAIEGYDYALIEGPEGMSLVNNELIWTPSDSQIGSYDVRVSALPKNAPATLEPVIGDFKLSVQGMTIDRVEIRADSKRIESISRSSYMDSATPYVISQDVNLGEMIELKISVRNDLPTHSDNELRDVEIELYSFDLIDADGQDAFISRIRTGRTEDQTITFLLDPDSVHHDDSPFDLEIRVTGETRSGDYYSDVWVLELRLESKSYNLLMTDAVVSPNPVCAGQRLRVSFDLRNIGTRDLSSAGVRYYVPELNINEWERNINIDYDDSRLINRFLSIPEDAIPGEYYLELIAHPRITSTSDTFAGLFLFNVKDCEPVEETPQEPPIVVQPTPPEVVVPGTPVSETVGSPTSVFDKEGNIYLILLTALVVLLLIGVILLLVSVFK